MIKVLLAVGLSVVFGQVAKADCESRTVIGADYFGAKRNCEVSLQGQSANCQPQGSGLWSCGCSFNCSDDQSGGGRGNQTPSRRTTTVGADYFGAKRNCEVILQGQSSNCQPQGSGLWSCQCVY